MASIFKTVPKPSCPQGISVVLILFLCIIATIQHTITGIGG